MNILKRLWLSRGEWRDVYIEMVAAGVILLFGILASNVWSWLAAIYVRPVSVPLWVLLVLGASMLFWILSVVHRLRISAHERLYRSEVINDILWDWTYRAGRVTGLIPFCIEAGCGTELILTEVHQPDHNGFRGTTIFCTHCNKAFGIGNAFNLPDHERRKIEKKIRDGTWEQPPKKASRHVALESL